MSEICNIKIQMHIKYRKILVEFWYCHIGRHKFIYDTDFKLIIIPLFRYVELNLWQHIEEDLLTNLYIIALSITRRFFLFKVKIE